MSIWDTVKKFAQPYADDDYDDYDDDYMDDYEEEEVQQPSRREKRRAAPAPAPVAPVMEEDEEEDDFGFPAMSTNTNKAPAAGFNGRVLSTSNKQAVVLFRPTSFNDTSKAADELNKRKAVIVNMENVDKAMARRVVDFLSGCVYALDGDVKKIAQSAYLFCPHNMDIVGDLEALQAEVESYI